MATEEILRYRVYSLTDPRTDEVRYIGITRRNLEVRLRGHLNRARGGEDTHRSRWVRVLLLEGLRPEISLIEETEDRSRECYWIRAYREDGCDLTNQTDGNDGHMILTEELKERIRKKVTGFKHTPEARAKISEAGKGRVFSQERRKKISQALMGRKCSPEHCRRIGLSKIGNKYLAGKALSEAAKAKISAAKKGKPGTPHTEESKAKIAQANAGNQWNKGRIHSEEARANMSKCKLGNKHNVGRVVSEATRKKISDSNKRWAAEHGASMKGKSESEESKRIQSESMKQDLSAKKATL